MSLLRLKLTKLSKLGNHNSKAIIDIAHNILDRPWPAISSSAGKTRPSAITILMVFLGIASKHIPNKEPTAKPIKIGLPVIEIKPKTHANKQAMVKNASLNQVFCDVFARLIN